MYYIKFICFGYNIAYYRCPFEAAEMIIKSEKFNFKVHILEYGYEA